MLKIFQKLLGIKYLINKSSGEVHRINFITSACGVNKMAKRNKWYVTEKNYHSLIKENGLKLNGCFHCFKETNTD